MSCQGIRNKVKNNSVLNLFAHDKIPISFWTIDHDDDVFDKNYFLCVSNENKKFVDEVYETINIFMDVQDVSKRDGKIGRFEKFERIIETRHNIPTVDIDEDDIPF